MYRIAALESATSRQPIRSAVIDLLAYAAPRPAALGAPTAEEQEFLETLRRIVARSAMDDIRGRKPGRRLVGGGYRPISASGTSIRSTPLISTTVFPSARVASTSSVGSGE